MTLRILRNLSQRKEEENNNNKGEPTTKDQQGKHGPAGMDRVDAGTDSRQCRFHNSRAERVLHSFRRAIMVVVILGSNDNYNDN